MRILALIVLAALAAARPVFAHDGVEHPKCKAGYILTDDHKCVKKG